MLYEALVIDNANFAKNGTIRVRIKDYTYDPNATRDMSKEPKKSIADFGGQEKIEKDGNITYVHNDTEAKVMSPIGGAKDYGLFTLPQPNSWGIVASLGEPWDLNSNDNFVWLGALYKKNTLNEINIPSSGESTKNGVTYSTEPVENIDNLSSAIVLKTKTTKITGKAEEISQGDNVDKSKESLDWSKRPFENLFVIDKDKFTVTHNMLKVEDDEEKSVGQSKVSFSENGIEIVHYNSEDDKKIEIKLSNDGDFYFKRAADTSSEVNITDDGVSITSEIEDGGNLSMTIGKDNTSGEKGIFFQSGNLGLSMKDDTKILDITSSGDVNINANNGGKVNINGGSLPVLVSPTGGDVIIDNTTLTASTTLFA